MTNDVVCYSLRDILLNWSSGCFAVGELDTTRVAVDCLIDGTMSWSTDGVRGQEISPSEHMQR